MSINVKKALKYIGNRAIILLVIVLVCLLVYSATFNTTKVKTFIADAMEDRAQVLLRHQGVEELSKYFDASYIEKDQALTQNDYSMYHITGYDYRLDITKTSVMWIAPTKATVTVEEQVLDIRGTLEGTDEDKIGKSSHPPAWPGARYKVHMSKHEGRWYITKIDKTKDL